MIPFILTVPWGLYATTPVAGFNVNHPLRNGDTITVDGRYGAILALPKMAELRFTGRNWRPQPEGGEFPWFDGPFRLCALPIAAQEREQEVGLEIHANGQVLSVTLKMDNHLLRPCGTHNSTQDASPADMMHGFILQVLARIREAESEHDPAECWDASMTGWDRLQAAWVTKKVRGEEAPLDLIVEHAERLPRRIDETASYPRRVLKRTRELMAIDRIQELDNACIEWLIRQPGRSVAEKAGPRQRLFGVTREENLDTLENRVLKDLLRLSADEARAYSQANKRYGNSERVKLVNRYHSLCRRHYRDLDDAGILRPTHPINPNYVLQHDSRYRIIWNAYREILSSEQRKDDLWRWQRRLWADFTRLAVVVAIDQLPSKKRVAMSPLHINSGQINGRWSDTYPLLAVFVLTFRNRLLVVEVLDITDVPPDDPNKDKDRCSRPDSWAYGLGCVAFVRLTDCDNGYSGSLCVWGVHGTATEPLPLIDLVHSADEALQDVLSQERRRTGQRVNVRGLVIRSTPDFANISADQMIPPIRCYKSESIKVDAEQGNLVYGITLDVDPDRINETFTWFDAILKDNIDRLFA